MPWDLTGNTAIKPTTNFLGTRDNQPLAIRTNNVERMRVTPTGDVGIGTTNPGSKLEVRGQLRTGQLFFTDPNGVPYPDNWIGMAQNIEGTTKWLHIGGITEGGVRRLALYANVTRISGDVEVAGDIRLLGADCAEEFDVSQAEEAEPGTVMVIDQEGVLKPSGQPYDKRVAGVVSGAEGYKPGIVFDKQESESERMPVALIGKVACKADARPCPIEVGDLLTTSSTPGHAMKADDPLKACGALIGKALRSLEGGQGTIPVLVALQ